MCMYVCTSIATIATIATLTFPTLSFAYIPHIVDPPIPSFSSLLCPPFATYFQPTPTADRHDVLETF